MDTLNGKYVSLKKGGHFLEDEGFTTFTSLQSRMQGYMTR